ncbi:ABC transporter permease [Dyella telluris]|uniref:ABC transporter permease n=1 Tax=Dyella telluris TaxID=2763498 RepID=A0A7G8Q768_9GAMM|nr:ABC transporter permease [Dyella telluris]QNK02626.1 ABC transporter permease [Dyella telluris]
MFGYYLDLAFHSLRLNKVLTALMVLAIAVGIGASMTTLTVVHLLSGDPLPGRSQFIYYPQVDADTKGKDSKEPLDMLDYQSAVDMWNAKRADRQALTVQSMVRLNPGDAVKSPVLTMMLSTTTDFFTMFDVPFRYGGPWSGQDDVARSRVAVITDDLNQKLFHGENSVGRTLRLRDSDVRIVGVLKPWRPSPQFYAVRGGRFADGDTSDFYSKPENIITPFFSGLEINDGNFQQFTCWHLPERAGHLVNSPCAWVALWVQLNDASKVADYRRFVADYAAQQMALGRFTHAGNTRMRSLMEWLDFNGVLPGDVRLQAWLAVAFLAICLLNTVGLLLAKFLRRSGEIGLRRALGASRVSVFAQYMVEAGMIGLIGGAFGWLLTLLGLWLIRQQPVAYADLARLDIPMFTLTFLAAIGASLMAGLLPAARACRVVPAWQLKTL